MNILHRLKDFIVDHYLVCAYSAIALLYVLFVLFQNDLPFLIEMLACLLVVMLFAVLGGLAYIVIRAKIADKCIDYKSLKGVGILAAVLIVLYPLLSYGLKIPDINKVYMMAPLASWPAFLAVVVLNIHTKWCNRKEKKRQMKQEKLQQSQN